MSKSRDRKSNLLCGFVFYALSSFVLGLVFFSYMFGVGDNSFMDFTGWVYFFFACLTHSLLLMLCIFVIVFLPLYFAKVKQKLSLYILAVVYALLIIVCVINRYVFQIYHFHINGFILDMLFSEGASEIFVFSLPIYLKAFAILLCVALCMFLIVKLTLYLAIRIHNTKKIYTTILFSIVAIILISQTMHVYASAKIKTSVLESSSFVPYYFPISMNSVLDKWGIIDKKNITDIKFKDKISSLNYPLKPIETTKVEKPLNIVFILIDSWNHRTFTQQCMPNTYSFMKDAEFFSHHLSSSNGTRGGLFGLFTALSPYYWKSFEYSSLRPVFLDVLEKSKYKIQLYPSATLKSPPFDRVLFKQLKGINTSTEGKTAYERDCNITNNFIKDLPVYIENKQPFFTLLFYDLPHAISLPKEKNTHFQPAWDYADYSKLNNNIDPLPFYNLYRNCVYQVDSLVGAVLENLKKHNLLENTVVIITGDHGQEFNENHKNYWGHSGNYSQYQVQVPLIFYYPNVKSRTYKHQTTHYDIIPTLMNMFLGVKNLPEDYSMGKYLYDTKQKGWHIVGNDLNYAFITEQGYIIEKSGAGYVKVYDSNLNLQTDYNLPAKQINDNLIRLNKFFK